MPSAKVHGAGGFLKKQIKNSGSQFTVHQIPLHDSDILTGDRSGISFPEPIWFFSLDEAASSAPKVPDGYFRSTVVSPKKGEGWLHTLQFIGEHFELGIK